jgi:hypothetical protein
VFTFSALIERLVKVSGVSFAEYPLTQFNCSLNGRWGARGSVVVKALCYRPEGRGFDT